jgi:hypothetical protein
MGMEITLLSFLIALQLLFASLPKNRPSLDSANRAQSQLAIISNEIPLEMPQQIRLQHLVMLEVLPEFTHQLFPG